MKTIFNDLVKYKNTFDDFTKWYRPRYKDINKFLVADFESQLGVILRYLDDVHNLGVSVDEASYLIYHIDMTNPEAILFFKKHNHNLLFENYGDNTSIFTNYRKGIIKTFAHVENPF